MEDHCMPANIALLPRDARGLPVPWFASWFDKEGNAHPSRGRKSDREPDFRVVDPRKIRIAFDLDTCWICGQILADGVFAFVIGPMCAMNQISSEPPSHKACAEFSARACPFLSKPAMRRNEKDLPEGILAPPGEMLLHNPGVTLIWVTRTFEITVESLSRPEGALFRIGYPEETLWYREGRLATRAEVLDALKSGFARLRELAHAVNEDGPMDLIDLQGSYERALSLAPAI